MPPIPPTLVGGLSTPLLVLPGMTAPPLSPDAPAPPDAVGADFAPPADAGPPPADEAAADVHLQDSVEAERLYELAVKEAEAGNEVHAVPYFLRASKYAEAAREPYLTARACHKAADIYRSPEPPYDLDRAVRIYRRAAAAYEQCGHYTEARTLSYDIAYLKLSRGRELGMSWWLRTELFLYWLIAGFGYRPGRVLASAATVVLGFALAYWLAGGVRSIDPAERLTFLDHVYFSGITFATVGYGDMLPAPHVRYLAMAEGATGAFAMSFFVVVLANRLRH